MNIDENDPLPNQIAPVPDPAPEIPFVVASEIVASNENPGRIAPSVPADLDVPWNWIDFVLLIVVALGGAVLIELVVYAVLPFFGISRAVLRGSSTQSLVIEISAQIVLDLALLAWLAIQIRAWYRKPFWRTIGWRALETEQVPKAIAYLGYGFGGFILVALVSLASAAIPPGPNLPIEAVFQSRPAVLLYMLTAVFVAPLVEETVFRGYLYPVIARSFGIGAGIAITGTLFGLLHAFQLWGGWWQIALLIFVGVVLTAVRAVARTVSASYMVHLVYNSAQVIAFLLATQGGRQIPHIN